MSAAGVADVSLAGRNLAQAGVQMHPATKPSALIPTATRSLPLAVAAKGARIFDESGRDYIDASSGPLAVTLGHGHPKVIAAVAEQFAAVAISANAGASVSPERT